MATFRLRTRSHLEGPRQARTYVINCGKHQLRRGANLSRTPPTPVRSLRYGDIPSGCRRQPRAPSPGTSKTIRQCVALPVSVGRKLPEGLESTMLAMPPTSRCRRSPGTNADTSPGDTHRLGQTAAPTALRLPSPSGSLRRPSATASTSPPGGLRSVKKLSRKELSHGSDQIRAIR